MSYCSREERQSYILNRFRSILGEPLCNVCGGGTGLFGRLGGFRKYVEIDIEGNPTHRINLEIEDRLPFPDQSFHTVLCLDGLEHLETIHAITAEIFRISKKNVILTLPNPVAEIFRWGRTLWQKNATATKFYGLPLEKPKDRHKWFFSNLEAEKFLLHFGKKYHFDLQGREIIFPKAKRRLSIPNLCRVLSGSFPSIPFFLSQSVVFHFAKR